MAQQSMIKIEPCDLLRGRIVLPASKSISARALILSALSGSTLLPENLSDSDDTQAMLKGIKTPSNSPVRGRTLSGTESLPLRGDLEGSIDIGAAGTAMRFLTAYLSVTSGTHTITGTERMKHRPIGILVEALRALGADITYLGEEGFPPLRIVGNSSLEGGELTVAGNVSSQYISALLMIAPTLKKGLRLTLTGQIASRPYLDMTISMMREFGAEVEWTSDNIIEVKAGAYKQRAYHIESDWSAASYWYEIVALSPDARAEVELVGLHRESLQGDSKVWQLFGELGVASDYYVEPDGTEIIRLRKTGDVTCYFNYDFTHQPDLAQTFAVTCTMLNIPFRLVGLQSLRIKETDRIAALEKELSKLADVEVVGDELRTPRSPLGGDFRSSNGREASGLWLPLKGAEGSLTFDTYDDHRMAMAFAPVCLHMDGQIQINDPQVVSKSYPAYWDDLKKVGFKICKEQ